jgi:hypothetical protein
MSLCIHCEHACHHGDGGKCASCDCLNCEHDIQEAVDKLEEVLKAEEKVVEFESDINLTEH